MSRVMAGMNYREARQYIGEAMIFGSVLGLDNIKELLGRMGNPQNKIPIIHVAGTNGKGSVIAYLYYILSNAGYRVGRYISPAVFEYRERIRIGEQNIEENEFADLIYGIKGNIEQMLSEGLPHPTAFEIETAAAYEYFYRQSCDVAIVETGLGGREDATNVIDSPLACVITSISLDHTQILGNTIEEITREKAGIIMGKAPVIMMNQSKEAVDEVRRAALSNESKLYITDKCYDIVYSMGMTAFSYDDRRYDTGMIGTFQPQNASVAIETAHILNEYGMNISEQNIYEGVKNTVWSGRFEKISDKPAFYLDGAHNPDAASKFADTLDKYFGNIPKIFIMGVLADKDYKKVCELTAKYAERIITITPDNSRALSGYELAKIVSCYNLAVEYQPDMKKAVKLAVKYAKKAKGVVIAFGSLSYLGEIKKYKLGKED